MQKSWCSAKGLIQCHKDTSTGKFSSLLPMKASFSKGLPQGTEEEINKNENLKKDAFNFLGAQTQFEGTWPSEHSCKSKKEGRQRLAPTELPLIHIQPLQYWFHFPTASIVSSYQERKRLILQALLKIAEPCACTWCFSVKNGARYHFIQCPKMWQSSTKTGLSLTFKALPFYTTQKLMYAACRSGSPAEFPQLRLNKELLEMLPVRRTYFILVSTIWPETT